jgi:uncharacterized protein (TIGR00255 family)
MLKSMTGYGQGSVAGADFKVTVDLRSVNNRNLDIQWRAPHELAALEIPLRKQVQAAVLRGRVDVTISFTQTKDAVHELNHQMIRGYLTALRAMREEFGLTGAAELAAIVRLPEAASPVSGDCDISETIALGVEVALAQALVALVAMRAVEGLELQKDLLTRAGRVADCLAVIEADAASIDKTNQDKLRKRLLDLTTSVAIDETRFAQEAAYLADRNSLTEEIARLKSYLAQLRVALTAGGEVGKKLDFLLQEMNRAANAMLSQLAEATTCDTAVEIKAEIEKLREQALNVE